MPENERTYPHMLPAESALWSAFLRKWGAGWSKYQYDVHVGDGVVLDSRYDVMTQGLARALTQKRIDVVAERHGEVWIFEVKLQAAINAFGQVMAYRDLYRRSYGYKGEVRLGIVTDQVLPDDKWVYESNGVRLFLVEATF